MMSYSLVKMLTEIISALRKTDHWAIADPIQLKLYWTLIKHGPVDSEILELLKTSKE